MALTTSLISYWKMDESSGTRVDSHGTDDLAESGGTTNSSTGKINSAANFVAANAAKLQHADDANLSTGDIDFTFACWVKLTSKTSIGTIFAKWSFTTFEFTLYYYQAIDRFEFAVRNSANSSTVVVDANNLGAVSTGTWYYIVVWHDSVNDTLNIKVNDGTADATAHSGGVRDGAEPFAVGAFSNAANYLDGLVDELAMWKRVLTSTEHTQLYNSGNGLAYPLTTSQTGTPGAGTVTITGVAPAATATGQVSVTPGVGTVTITGVAPAGTASGSVTQTPTTATVTITGVAPAASGTGTGTATPGVGTVTITGVDAAASISGSATATSGVATVTITGVSPAASGQGTGSATPGVGTVTIAGVSPAASIVTSGTATAGVGTVTITGVSPAASATGTVTLTPGVGTVTVSSADVQAGNQTATPGAGTVTITGVAVAGSPSGNVMVMPGVAIVTIRGVTLPSAGGGSAFRGKRMRWRRPHPRAAMMR